MTGATISRQGQLDLFGVIAERKRRERALAVVRSGSRAPDDRWAPPTPRGPGMYVEADALAAAATKALTVAAGSRDRIATIGVAVQCDRFGFFVFAGRVAVAMMAEAVVWAGDDVRTVREAVDESVLLLHHAGIASRTAVD